MKTKSAEPISQDYPGLPKAMSLLVVEDENRLRDLLMDTGREMGFASTGAATGEEALRLMRAEPRQVMIADLNLPAMNGIDLIEQIRAQWPQTQAIVLTGFGSLQAAQQAIHLDVVEFLTKPSPLSEIEKALHRARLRIDQQRVNQVPAVEELPAIESKEPAETLADHERQIILAALRRHGGNRTQAAAELGISRRTLHYRLQEYQQDGFFDDRMKD